MKGRVATLQVDVRTLLQDGQGFCAAKAATDEELYERSEKHKVLCNRLNTTLEECKLLANQALEHDLIEQSTNLDGAVVSLRGLKLDTDNAMLSSRRTAGVWSEKGRRSAARGDVKMPVFSGASGEKLTVYEFEKEWMAYKAVANYSVEEALKEMKMAVQPPTRAAVQKMTSEKQVLDYLKAHFGNPVLLLSAREEEVRSWNECKGTDAARREWLIHAKDRLEATITLCEEHGITKYMHFSSIAGLVQNKLPADMVRDYKKILVEHLSPAGVLEKEIILGLLVKFIEDKIRDCTLGVNLDIVSFLGTTTGEVQRQGERQQQDQQKQSGFNKGSGWTKQKYSQHSVSQPVAGDGHHGAKGTGDGSGRAAHMADPTQCVSCGCNHPALFYCEAFIKSKVADRFEQVKAQKSCGRCLTMKRKFTGRKSEWWAAHERYCRNGFVCREGVCYNKPKDKQSHLTLCPAHVADNKAREGEFIKSLDPKYLPSGASPGSIWFLHMGGPGTATTASTTTYTATMTAIDENGYEIIPDVGESGLFLMQALPSESSPADSLLCFYDSGCASAGLSDRAYHMMKTTTVRPGPTVLEVAGAKSILIPYGEEQFHLELASGKKKATVTGLHMPNITAEFPLVELANAWIDTCSLSWPAANRPRYRQPSGRQLCGHDSGDPVPGPEILPRAGL